MALWQDNMDVSQIVTGVLQLKEIIALVTLVAVIAQLLTKLIPFLLMREQERNEKDAARHQANYVKLEECVERLAAEIRGGLLQLKDALVEIAKSNGRIPKG